MRFYCLFPCLLASLVSLKGFAGSTSNIQLIDVGVLGLATHDLFKWNNKEQKSEENGRFDLSTIFDYQKGQAIQAGGDPKNSENAPVFTVTRSLVHFYQIQKDNLMKYAHMPEAQAHAQARKETVAQFLSLVKTSYERVTGMPFPRKGIDAAVSNSEQAGLRAMHDLLPGKMKLYRGHDVKTVLVTDFRFAQTLLSHAELSQSIASFDGAYDPEYREIKLPNGQVMDLQELDRLFIEGQSRYKQQTMLSELAEKPFSEVSFAGEIQNAFAKGICAKGNPWLPEQIECK